MGLREQLTETHATCGTISRIYSSAQFVLNFQNVEGVKRG